MQTETALAGQLRSKPPAQLRVEELSIRYQTTKGPFHAVDKVSFSVDPGTTLGLVGESGCGKSTVIKALMGLLPAQTAITGQAVLDGRNILGLSERALRDVRWTQLALITQSAMNSLDPVYRVGDQIVESIRAHVKVSRDEAWSRAEEMFDIVGLPAKRLHEYPHQFSGGMRQRAVIAMALSLNAGLLLADEPTTALDPIMQDQIMARIRGINAEMQRSMILVTHDIAVVSETCDTIAVMYAGQIVEWGETATVLGSPRHPYTMGLQNAFPRLLRKGEPRLPLISIPGTVPNLLDPPRGCRFAGRCPFATDLCRSTPPPATTPDSRQSAACHHADRAVEFRDIARKADTWRRKET